jgi:hypothetical protein
MPTGVYERRPPEDRFWDKVNKAPGQGPGGDCWEWQGSLDAYGYGRFGHGKRWGTTAAHRISYFVLVGAIPRGLQIDHLCRVRHCVNPVHLEPVTSQVNTLRGNSVQAANAAKTHCEHGHEFTVNNTYWSRGRWRKCRTCHRIQNRTRRARAAIGGTPTAK